MAEIRVENLRKEFGSFVAVQNSSFVVEDGEFFVMLGPSGCGKTTTLRMIAGLELPTGGRILLDGEDVTMKRARERDIAFVFQLFALYPHMNVRKNIGFPLLAQGMPKAEIRQRVEETAKLLRIDHLLDRSVSGLAGGDRQRVALGRAIVRRPKCFLMDEPLGTLDTEFRDLMVHELRELHNRIHATTVYVTHDQMEAMSMADKIAVMNHGVIEQFGTPREIYDRPGVNVCRRLHGLAADELPCRSAAGCRRARTRSSCRARASPCRKSARTSRRPTWRLASGPSISGSTTRRSCAADLRRRISGHDADRRGRDGGRHAQGARSGRHPAVAGETVGLSFNAAAAVAVRQGLGPRDPHRRCSEEARAWLTSRSAASPSASATRRRSTASTSPSPMASSSCCSGRPAPARPRRLRLIAGLERPDAADRHRRARRHRLRARSARRRLRVPAILALSASHRLREPRLPAALAGAPDGRGRDRAPRRRESRSWCASTTSWRTGRRNSRAARCSAWRSAARWCASRPST